MVLPEEDLHVQVTGWGWARYLGGGVGRHAWAPPRAPRDRPVHWASTGRSRRSFRTREHTAGRPRTHGKRDRSLSLSAQRSECPWPREGRLGSLQGSAGFGSCFVNHWLYDLGNGPSSETWVQVMAGL